MQPLCLARRGAGDGLGLAGYRSRRSEWGQSRPARASLDCRGSACTFATGFCTLFAVIATGTQSDSFAPRALTFSALRAYRRLRSATKLNRRTCATGCGFAHHGGASCARGVATLCSYNYSSCGQKRGSFANVTIRKLNPWGLSSPRSRHNSCTTPVRKVRKEFFTR
jgi:hypothetical protein